MTKAFIFSDTIGDLVVLERKKRVINLKLCLYICKRAQHKALKWLVKQFILFTWGILEEYIDKDQSMYAYSLETITLWRKLSKPAL